MQKIEIVGYKRANLGKATSSAIRNEGNVPGVLYGGATQVHFYAPVILFRDLLYTPNVYEVELNIEGTVYRAILQDAQFHPVNDTLIHVDFLEVNDSKKIKVDVPIKFVGASPGVLRGGKLVQKLRKISLKGTVNQIPDFIEVQIGDLDLGKSRKVGDISVEGCQILNPNSNPICTIDIPRALRGKVTA
ncbi:MAG: 50S ribosomal protein L25/general stress protein Ctc [Spirosomataceae bacterium]